MAWSDLTIVEADLKGIEDADLFTGGSIIVGALTSDNIATARDTVADRLLEESEAMRYLDAYGSETAFLDAVQANSQLVSRVQRALIFAWLHHWYFGDFLVVDNTDYEKQDHYWKRCGKLTKQVAVLIPTSLAPTTKPSGLRSMSVVLSGTTRYH